MPDLDGSFPVLSLGRLGFTRRHAAITCKTYNRMYGVSLQVPGYIALDDAVFNRRMHGWDMVVSMYLGHFGCQFTLSLRRYVQDLCTWW